MEVVDDGRTSNSESVRYLPCSLLYQLTSIWLKENADWAWCRLEAMAWFSQLQKNIGEHDHPAQFNVTPFLTHWQDGRSEGWLPRNVLIVEPGSGPGQNPFAMAIFPWWESSMATIFSMKPCKVMPPTRWGVFIWLGYCWDSYRSQTCHTCLKKPYLGGGFKHLLFSPLPGKMIQFDEHIFQGGWNHQLDMAVHFHLQFPDFVTQEDHFNHFMRLECWSICCQDLPDWIKVPFRWNRENSWNIPFCQENMA